MSVEQIAFGLTTFERIRASDATDLLRLAGVWRGIEHRGLGEVVLVLDDGFRTHRFAVLAGAPSTAERAGPEGLRWQGAYSVPAEARRMDLAAFSLELETGESWSLPAPAEQRLPPRGEGSRPGAVRPDRAAERDDPDIARAPLSAGGAGARPGSLGGLKPPRAHLKDDFGTGPPLVGTTARAPEPESGPRELQGTGVRGDDGAPSGSARGGYRPALDGVRAVAVLAVIAYHVSNKKPSGGFLGVDVFFVLSGYLITTLLLRAWMERGRISLSEFWARRARRLLPALMLLVAVVALWIAHSAPVATLPARRADLISTLLYYANWHFIASDQSYFAAYTGASPLRHVWSLAIEEQFYLIWPPIVLAALSVGRRGRRLLLGLIGLGAVFSVARMASLYQPADPSRSYFGTDARAHALLIGAGLAVLLLSRPALLTHPRARAAAAWSSPIVALALLGAFALFHEKSAFYYQAGAALFALFVALALWVVEAVPRGFLGALLTVRPLRWVGTISYGLYLWHWPMIIWLAEPARELVATFAVATLSFYLLERPIRYGSVPWLRLSRPRLAVVMSACLVAVGAVALEATKLRSSLAREVTDTSQAVCPPDSPRVGTGQVGALVGGATWCSRTDPASPSSSVVATIGDSTSTALNPGMGQVAGERGWRYIQAGVNGCPALMLVVPPTPSADARLQAESCQRYVPVILAQVDATYHPTVWLISDITGLDSAADSGGIGATRTKALETSIRERLRQLTVGGGHVVILAPLPPAQPLECNVRSSAPTSCRSVTYTTAGALTAIQDRLFRSVAREFPGKVAVVSVADILCPGGTCPPVIGGHLARYDGVHFTASFSRTVVRTIIARAAAARIPFTSR